MAFWKYKVTKTSANSNLHRDVFNGDDIQHPSAAMASIMSLIRKTHLIGYESVVLFPSIGGDFEALHRPSPDRFAGED